MIHEIRAHYTDAFVKVYQAFDDEIADAALRAQRFVAPFQMDRVTWIKPSLNWMLHRSGCAAKIGQRRILAIDIERAGFDWALDNAVLRESSVHVQWDRERDFWLRPVEAESAVQIGLGGEALRRYVGDWTLAIDDVTDLAQRRGRILHHNGLALAPIGPQERTYPMTERMRAAIVPR